MEFLAVKIGLRSGEIGRIFEVDSAAYVEKFARRFWGVDESVGISVEDLYTNTSEFKDVEFSNVYEKYFDEIPAIKGIYIEFGAPQYDGTISNREYRVLTNFISFLRIRYTTSLQIILVFPKNFPKSSSGGAYLLEHFKNEISNASIYLYQEHIFLCSSASIDVQDKILKEMKEDNSKLYFTMSEKFGHNIVCHLGKFQTEEFKNRIIYDFYDGSRASSEAYSILKNLFQNSIDKRDSDKVLRVIYDKGGYFEWFEDALVNAEKDIVKDLSVKIEILSAESYLENEEKSFPDMFLCPVIRSGGTLSSVLQNLQNKFSTQSIPEIHCLIYANGEDENQPRAFNIQLNNTTTMVNVHSIVQRGARGAFLKEIWKDSSFPAQYPDELTDYFEKFSSASMWGMLFETEIGKEKSTRKRKQINRFPNFLEIFERNKPLFVHKIRAIESHLGLIGRFKYIVPDEKVPLKIAETLCSEFGETSIVAVPSKVLEVASGFVGADWNDFEGAITDEDFAPAILKQFEQLAGLRRSILDEGGFDTARKSYCVLDACRVTGTTIRGLEAIVGMLGGNVAATITLADFTHLSERSTPVDGYRSLYSFGG